MPRTSETKQKIFLAAVDCFAEHGYKASSMRDIANLVGVKASSIYKHFSAKREILAEILDYYRHHFNKYRVPPASVLKAAESKPMTEVIPMLFYTFGTEDEYNVMIKISRIVENLKFENEEAGKLFRESFITESMEYLRAVFGELVAAGKLKPGDYEAAAFQITSFANMIYVLNLLNGSKREDFNKKYNDGIAFLTKVLFELR